MLRPETDFAGRQIAGGRETQEDYYAFEELENGELLLAVADGVGGHVAGQVASEAAVLGFFDGFHDASGADPLVAGLAVANERLAAAIDDRPDELSGMGTTLVGIHIGRGSMRWISVGDSPLFLFRDGILGRLNADHSAGSLRDGTDLPRSLLFSALTGSPIPDVDLRSQPFPLEPGDTLLVASDGILALDELEIAAVLAARADAPADELSRALLDEVLGKERPNQDNTTVALVRVPA